MCGRCWPSSVPAFGYGGLLRAALSGLQKETLLNFRIAANSSINSIRDELAETKLLASEEIKALGGMIKKLFVVNKKLSSSVVNAASTYATIQRAYKDSRAEVEKLKTTSAAQLAAKATEIENLNARISRLQDDLSQSNSAKSSLSKELLALKASMDQSQGEKSAQATKMEVCAMSGDLQYIPIVLVMLDYMVMLFVKVLLVMLAVPSFLRA